MKKKDTNKRLTSAELHYREIFEKASDGICILDMKTGIILNANNKVSEITGYSIEELIGRPFSDVTSLNSGSDKMKADKKILLTAKRGTQQFEWELKNKDGNIHWAEIHFTIAKIGGIERIIGFFNLIDARKKAEISLQTSEANLRSILNHTDVAFILLNKVFEILSWNKQANRWSVLAFGKRLKENTNLISIINKDRQSTFIAKLKKAINGIHIDYETKYTLKDGSEEWYRVRIKPVRNQYDSLIGVCLSAINVTNIKNSEIESQKLTQDLIQRNKDLEQFACIVSHNLRAPIANIIGLSDQLRKTGLADSKERQFTIDLYVTVKQLDNVIKDLNHILQIKHQLNEAKRIVSFSEIITEIQTSIDQLIRTNDVKITYDFSKADRMMILKSYLYSIFYNLITNSIKYRKEKVRPELEISSKVKGEKVEITFRDNGLGIDLVKSGDQLFGLYKRFHSHVEGKGMGLYMVKQQVESLGGSIFVVSEVNAGTDFRIEFPYEPIQEHLLNRQYVVIDDDYINNLLCEHVITDVYPDAKVHTFTDPGLALEFIGSPAWSMAESTIILLDVNMPNLTGWEFLEIFKQLDDNIKQNCEIYMLSSSIDKRDKLRAAANPLVSDFIEKPLSEEWVYRI